MKTSIGRLSLGIVSVGCVLLLGITTSASADEFSQGRTLAFGDVPPEYKPTANELNLEAVEESTVKISEQAHALDDALRVSGWRDFSSVSINDGKTIVIHAMDVPTEKAQKIIAETAPDFEVTYQRSKFLMDDYNEQVDSLVAALGKNKSLLVSAGPAEDESQVEVALLDARGLEEAKAAVIEHFAGFHVRFQIVPEKGYKELTPFGWRSDDTPYAGGVQIYHPSINGCSTGFSANRKSDGARVMITAWHCNGTLFNYTNRIWSHDSKTIGGAPSGFMSPSTNDVDAMYFSRPNGSSSFGSIIYVGSWTSSNTKLRKNAGNPILGETLTSGGAYSGGSTQTVTRINTLSGTIGRGFMLHDNGNERTVGRGDSGGPVHRSYSDGTYGARGIVRGQGEYKNASGDWVPSTLGACSQGIEITRECSRDSFNMNIETIETKLGVTVYPS